jgi:hypothetical protein
MSGTLQTSSWLGPESGLMLKFNRPGLALMQREQLRIANSKGPVIQQTSN